MKLDKNHLNQFENIAPPMVNALTIPVVGGVSNVCIYVCQSPFAGVAGPQKRKDVLAVAKALALRPESISTITDPTFLALLVRAVDIVMHAPGGHQDVADGLVSAINNVKLAIDKAREALIADSWDEEHDALVSFLEAVGETVPEREDQ